MADSDAEPFDIPGAGIRIGSYAKVWDHSRFVFRIFLRDRADQQIYLMDFEDAESMQLVLEILENGPAYYVHDTNEDRHLVYNDWRSVP